MPRSGIAETPSDISRLWVVHDGTPNIPYMGINQYAQLLGRQPFSVRESGEGARELENWNGARLICTPEEDRIDVKDWNAFFALPMPLEDRALGLKDTNLHYARIADIDYEGEARPVTIDFAKYGIKLYSDESDIYLPVSTLSNMMTDLAGILFLWQSVSDRLSGSRGSFDRGTFRRRLLLRPD